MFGTWQREIKLCTVSDGKRVVGKCLKNFLIPSLGQVVYGNGEIHPKPCARNTQLLALNKSQLSGLSPKFSQRATISQLARPK
jgi:hypothetical protein